MNDVPSFDPTAGFPVHAFFCFGVGTVVVHDHGGHTVYLKEIWNHSYHSCNHHWIVRNDSDEVGEEEEDGTYFSRSSDSGGTLLFQEDKMHRRH